MPEPDADEVVLDLFCNKTKECLPTAEASPGYVIQIVSMLSSSVFP